MTDAPTSAHAAHSAAGGPFELALEKVGATGLRAQLKNRSSRRQPYLHDPMLQPVELVIVGADEKPVTATDRRKVMKFDRTLYHQLYAELTLAPRPSSSMARCTWKRSPPARAHVHVPRATNLTVCGRRSSAWPTI